MVCRPAVFLVLAAVALGCGQKSGPGGAKGGPPGKDAGPPLVTVGVPLVKTVTQFTDVTGTMKAVKRVEVRPQVSGYIKEVLFKDGADVKKGDVLVTIDPVLYQADVKKAEGDLQNAVAQQKLAAAEASRVTRLRDTGSVTSEEYDRAVAQKGVTEANITSAQAGLDRAKQNLTYTKVTAPISGRADRILVTEGNLVAGGTGQATILTTLVSVDPMYAYFDMDEETVLYYLSLIRAGKFQSVRQRRIPVELQLKGQAGYPYKGELEFAGSELNPTTGSLQVRAAVPNPPPQLFTPGMFVRARLPGAQVENALLIPDSAVAVDQDRKVVYVVTPENKVSVRPVKVGPLSEGLRVIVDGVRPGERVILRGMQRVQEGVPVEVQVAEVKPVDPAAPTPPVAPGQPAEAVAPAEGGGAAGGK